MQCTYDNVTMGEMHLQIKLSNIRFTPASQNKQTTTTLSLDHMTI